MVGGIVSPLCPEFWLLPSDLSRKRNENGMKTEGNGMKSAGSVPLQVPAVRQDPARPALFPGSLGPAVKRRENDGDTYLSAGVYIRRPLCIVSRPLSAWAPTSRHDARRRSESVLNRVILSFLSVMLERHSWRLYCPALASLRRRLDIFQYCPVIQAVGVFLCLFDTLAGFVEKRADSA